MSLIYNRYTAILQLLALKLPRAYTQTAGIILYIRNPEPLSLLYPHFPTFYLKLWTTQYIDTFLSFFFFFSFSSSSFFSFIYIYMSFSPHTTPITTATTTTSIIVIFPLLFL